MCFIQPVFSFKTVICLLCVGETWLYGCWFYRPTETFHLATRKFLENEVFKGDYYNKVPFNKVLGKCVVMFVKVRPHKYGNLLINPRGAVIVTFCLYCVGLF